MGYFDRLTGVLLFLSGASLFWNVDFFFGLLLFLINYISFKVIIKTLFAVPEENNSFARKYIFIPAILIKMVAIGIISYLVLVYLNGNPYFYIGGFALGLAVFTLGLFLENLFSKHPRRTNE